MVRKGLELPINMIIVIAIAVLVLVVVIAFFVGQTGQGVNTIQLENAFTSSCQTWRNQYSCSSAGLGTPPNTVGFLKPGTQTLATMGDLCTLKGLRTTGLVGAAYDTADSCERQCGCPRG